MNFKLKYLEVDDYNPCRHLPCEDGARCFAHKTHPCDRCGRLQGIVVAPFMCSADINVGDTVFGEKVINVTEYYIYTRAEGDTNPENTKRIRDNEAFKILKRFNIWPTPKLTLR